MRCDAVAQCGDLSDEENCNSIPQTDTNEVVKTEIDSNRGGLEFISNEVIEIIPEGEVVEIDLRPPPDYYLNEDIYKKCGGSTSSKAFVFDAPTCDKKMVYYLPSTNKHLPPTIENLASIELFECCTVPNFFILGNMVCDGIAQCPDMSDECVCFFSRANKCNLGYD